MAVGSLALKQTIILKSVDDQDTAFPAPTAINRWYHYRLACEALGKFSEKIGDNLAAKLLGDKINLPHGILFTLPSGSILTFHGGDDEIFSKMCAAYFPSGNINRDVALRKAMETGLETHLIESQDLLCVRIDLTRNLNLLLCGVKDYLRIQPFADYIAEMEGKN